MKASEASSITFSPMQEDALALFQKWWNRHKAGDETVSQTFYMQGYAGTGKTTLLKEFVRICSSPTKERFSYLPMAFTGKAALQMRRSGLPGAQTIHSTIYKIDEDAEERSEPIFILDKESPAQFADLLVLDEVSMVDEVIGEDVLSFKKPTLIVGDPGQLPPIKGAGYFTNRRPDVILTEVHRQALESPIIRLATDIRGGKTLRAEAVGSELIVYPKTKLSPDQVLQFDQMICGKNVTRTWANEIYRVFKGYNKQRYPMDSERLICLRNNRKVGLFNGLIITCEGDAIPDGDRVILSGLAEDKRRFDQIQVHSACFDAPEMLDEMSWQERREFEEFAYGYCITVHKSQGSQWDSVCLVDDGMLQWDKQNRRRWLYTGITRAAKKLIIVRK